MQNNLHYFKISQKNLEDLLDDFYVFDKKNPALGRYVAHIREIKNIFNEIEKDVQVFIGRESGDKRFNDFSLVVSRCENKRIKRGVVGVLGPKRMDYEKNIQLVSYAKKLIKEL